MDGNRRDVVTFSVTEVDIFEVGVDGGAKNIWMYHKQSVEYPGSPESF